MANVINFDAWKTFRHVTLPVTNEPLVIMPLSEYNDLKKMAVESIEKGAEELFPVDILDRVLNGESPIRIFREYRKMSVSKLAEMCGLTQPAISHYESGVRQPSKETFEKIAHSLSVDAELLTSPTAREKAPVLSLSKGSPSPSATRTKIKKC